MSGIKHIIVFLANGSQGDDADCKRGKKEGLYVVNSDARLTEMVLQQMARQISLCVCVYTCVCVCDLVYCRCSKPFKGW